MNVIKGLTGCLLGFAGGLAVIVLAAPDRLAASAAQTASIAGAPAGGERFLRVRITR